MNQDEGIIFSISLELKPNKIFIYKGESFNVDFNLIKRNCRYFDERKSEIKRSGQYEMHEIIDIPIETMRDFLDCCQIQRTTIHDFFGVNYLSTKYQNEKLKSFTDQYIEKHYDELLFQSFAFKQKILESKEFQLKNDDGFNFDTTNEERIISSHLFEYLQDERIFSFPINVLDRIIKNFLNENKEKMNDLSTRTKFNNFLLVCLTKYNREASVLFTNINFGKLDRDLIVKLHNEFSEIFDFNMIDAKSLFNETYDLIGEVAQIRMQQKCASDEMIEYKKKIEDEINEIREEMKKMRSWQSAENENQAKLQLRIKGIEESQNNSVAKNQEFEDKCKSEIQDLNGKISSINENVIQDMKSQLNDSNNEQKSKLNELENQLKNRLASSENEIIGIHNWMKFREKIVACSVNGLVISFDLMLNCEPFDTAKSKYIISTSNAEKLGSEAYEKGEPITSKNMNASFICKPGTYYVRCIVFSSDGDSIELVSNPVTTCGSSLAFNYEGKPAKISLYKGQYKLEVWGAKGGNSSGGIYNTRKSTSIDGGLGGYSCGILNLNKNETVYVYVGGEGCPSDWPDGSVAKGGFPDGGGAKTGHSSNRTPEAVPGTGGGSTSIRIGSDTNYTRVIVAGGGGGASGSFNFADPGGFGGGLSGGNCSYTSSPQNQAAGTQTGRARGLGERDDRHGDPGQFGLGATGKYCQGCDSGGGGGGGWYGGGSGGYGHSNFVSSGGGGSGWTFTASSYKAWQSGDPNNSKKFILDSSYYLTDEKCLGGNEEFPKPDGNGTEIGHSGNGYAKITPL